MKEYQGCCANVGNERGETPTAVKSDALNLPRFCTGIQDLRKGVSSDATKRRDFREEQNCCAYHETCPIPGVALRY